MKGPGRLKLVCTKDVMVLYGVESLERWGPYKECRSGSGARLAVVAFL